MKNFSEYSQNELNSSLVIACETGDLKLIKYLLTSPELSNKATIYIHDNRPLQVAVENNRLEVVQYLLTSKEIIYHAQVTETIIKKAFTNNNEDCFNIIVKNALPKQYVNIFNLCCEKENLSFLNILMENMDITKIDISEGIKILCNNWSEKSVDILLYLLEEKKLFNNRMVHYLDDEAFNSGYLPLIKALYEKNYIHIDRNSYAEIYAIAKRHYIEVLDYLFTHPDENLKIETNFHNNTLFKTACMNGFSELVNYLLFDLKIEITDDMYQSQKGRLEIQHLMDKRLLHDKMNQEFIEEKENKVKIKI